MQTEKQKERLVELLDNLPNGELLTKDVADYLLANNVVVLPCKVGDTVHSFSADFEAKRYGQKDKFDEKYFEKIRELAKKKYEKGEENGNS